MQRKLKSMAAAVVLAAAASVNAAPSADETAADKALAERFAMFGQQTLASRAVAPATLRQAAAQLEEAFALAPDEPRFGRLLTEAYLQLGGDEGRKGAIGALDRYRKLAPGDQASQIRLIELYAGMVETAEKLGKYYDQLLADDAIAAPVKSHVAIMAANLAHERGDNARQSEMTDAAVRLFPLSVEALEAKYSSLPDDAKPTERLQILLKLIQANPGQPAVMNTIADICADAGLYDSALNWYQQSSAVSSKLGTGADLRAMTEYAAELVVADQPIPAATNIKSLLEADPTDAEAGILGLVLSMKSSDPARIDAAADTAKNAIRARLAQLSAAVTQNPAPTTQPLDDNGVSADVAKLKDADNENLKALYTATLVDLAWVDIYGRGKPADAQPTMNALRELLPQDSATLARLDGWSALANGDKATAQVKLSAAADRDPLAQLGMVRLNGVADNDTARKLISDHPSGVLGAILIEALRGRGMVQAGPDAPAIRSELDKFPRAWLNLLDNARQFYVLKAAPAENKIAFNYGDPILVQTTITNTGTLDLTVGATGAVRPDLWFDVNVRGINQQTLAGVAFDRMGGKLVLGPKESNTQVVRLDQGQLFGLLGDNPGTSIPLYGSVLTNPLTQSIGVSPGPAGTREQFSNVIERTAAPLNDSTVVKASSQVVNGSGDERVRNIDLLAALVRQIRAANKPELMPRAQEMTDLIRKSTGDRVAAVRAESFATTAALSDAAGRQSIVQQMLSDSEPMIRAIGLSAAQRMTDGKTIKELAKPLADGDADPIVKKLAAAIIEVADLPVPTTQASTPAPAATPDAQPAPDTQNK